MLFSSSLKFPNMFNLTSGSTDIESQYTSINRCIALILTTAKGELIMNPNFGCTLYEQLFNAAQDDTFTNVKEAIVQSIKDYEDRVDVNTRSITITPNADKTRYNINISYTVKNTELSNTVTVTLNEEDALR